MFAIDTNVLVRILIDDEPYSEQVKIARQFAKKHTPLFIPSIVQIELIWVLEYSYKFSKLQLIHVLTHLNENEAFALQDKHQFSQALSLFEKHSADFSYCMIYEQATQENYELVTFDKKFAKLPKTKKL